MNRTIAATAGLLLVALIGCEVDDETGHAEPSTEQTSDPQRADKPGKKSGEKSESAETASQANARESAQNYIDMTAFSASGLVEQLEFEGYSSSDAEYAVDALRVNWKKQAALSAAAYLDMTAFSRSGLIEQLQFDGYTRAQAEDGATQAGL